ncbi:MAG: hypothetical protein AAFY56_06150 [Pseudomonadota bacterium]
MKQLVTNVLSRDEVSKIDFIAANIKVSSLGFNAVKKGINDNKIKVRYSSKLPRNTARYNYTKNRLSLNFRTLQDDHNREALIVHECVHAICDIAGNKLLVAHGEAAAYIAQAQYFYYRNQDALDDGSMSMEFSMKILDEAWDLAAQARENSTLSEDDLTPLIKAISKHPLYRKRHDKHDHCDGI